jgi:hypothetical protein
MNEEVKEETEAGNSVADIDIENTQFFKHETVTDGAGIVIDMLTPISINNGGKTSIDKDKPRIFVGKTPVETPRGIIPFSFPIEAANLKAALKSFSSQADIAIQKENEKIKEMQNQIVVPNEEKKIIT